MSKTSKLEVPIASYTELLKRRLNALRTLARSLRESQVALLERDSDLSSEFTEQQIDLCNEIEFLDRDLRGADEILLWAKALQPDSTEVAQLRRHTKGAEAKLIQDCLVQSSLLRRAKRSLTVMMAIKPDDVYYSPASYQAVQYSEEV